MQKERKDKMERKNIKILFIDDEPDILYLVGKMLEKESFIVDFAETGYDGMKKLEKNDYDLILLDIVLPDIDGWELCKILKEKMKKKKKEIPIVALTIRTSESSVEKSFSYANCDAYIGKPFKRIVLINTIKWVLKYKQHKSIKYTEEMET